MNPGPDGRQPSENGDGPLLPAKRRTEPSFLAKAKKAINSVSSQASTAGGTLASKAATLGASGAGKATEVARGAADIGKSAYSGSKLESTISFVDGELDQRGIKKAVTETAGAVVDKLDELTGKRLVELFEKRLKLQDEYNDILATRLAEALERISNLEARLKDAN